MSGAVDGVGVVDGVGAVDGAGAVVLLMEPVTFRIL